MIKGMKRREMMNRAPEECKDGVMEERGESQINVVLDNQREACKQLVHEVKLLANRLTPVLSDFHEEKLEDCEKSSCSVPLAAEIRDNTILVAEVTALLHDINSRIQL